MHGLLKCGTSPCVSHPGCTSHPSHKLNPHTTALVRCVPRRAARVVPAAAPRRPVTKGLPHRRRQRRARPHRVFCLPGMGLRCCCSQQPCRRRGRYRCSSRSCCCCCWRWWQRPQPTRGAADGYQRPGPRDSDVARGSKRCNPATRRVAAGQGTCFCGCVRACKYPPSHHTSRLKPTKRPKAETQALRMSFPSHLAHRCWAAPSGWAATATPWSARRPLRQAPPAQPPPPQPVPLALPPGGPRASYWWAAATSRYGLATWRAWAPRATPLQRARQRASFEAARS